MRSMDGEIRPTLGEILSALSHALDLTEGQPRGHSVRSCLIALRIARELGLSERQLESLYYATLLKDSGSSFDLPRVAALHRKRVRTLTRIKVRLGLAPAPIAEGPADLADVRGYRAGEIVSQLGFGEDASEAVLSLDERWDGSGGPRRLQGTAITPLARIIAVAQTAELLVSRHGFGVAESVLKRYSGRWFDPEVVRAVLKLKDDRQLWGEHSRFRILKVTAMVTPKGAEQMSEAGLDEVCEAFAKIVDAKSAYTAQHSTRVMQIATAAGERLGATGDRLANLRRAALLHDIGKLGVPTEILEKEGSLDVDELKAVRRHSRYSFEILAWIHGFGRISDLVAAHHERIDGSGYWRGLEGKQLDLDMRVLATADVFDALSSGRPYRAPMPLDNVYAHMKADRGLDPECVRAVWDAVAENRDLSAVNL